MQMMELSTTPPSLVSNDSESSILYFVTSSTLPRLRYGLVFDRPVLNHASFIPRKRSALLITETELRLIAAAANIGLSNRFSDSG